MRKTASTVPRKSVANIARPSRVALVKSGGRAERVEH
jgi:hypothetical protein